jgi:hypothetical protein
MRTGLALTLALVLAVVPGACGSDGSGDDGGGDDNMGTPDAAPPEEPAVRLESPEIDIPQGAEITYCWYFRALNTQKLAIHRWESTMSPGSHHLILFTSMNDIKPPGTVSTVNCGAGASLSSFPTWMYSAQTAKAEMALPADDGEGKPLAMELAPNQSGFIQLHYNNRGDTTIKAQVTVNGYALAESVAYTRTAAFVTYNDKISIPPMATGDIEAMTCNVPATSKFWMMSTHSHKQSVRTAVLDGMPGTGTKVFESTDWEHPGESRWDGPFHTFQSGKLTYECEYNNPYNRTITDGDSAQSDEMCMASGYFFPATRPVFCYNQTTF